MTNQNQKAMDELIEELKRCNYKPYLFSTVSRMDHKHTNGLTDFSKDFLRRYDYLKKLRTATGAIDFECEFGKHGDDRKCRGIYGTVISPKRPMCCCVGCASTNGYHHDNALLTPAEVLNIRKLFNGYLGFWRPDEGCILSRGLRSNTCVFYNCIAGKGSDKAYINKRAALVALESVARGLEQELIAQTR